MTQTKARGVPRKKSLRSPQERNALVEANIGLIYHFVDALYTQHPTACRAYPREDAESDAKIGLIRAGDLYDESSGYKFSTYASYWIRREITVGLHEATLVRVPRDGKHRKRKSYGIMSEDGEELFGMSGELEEELRRREIRDIVEDALRFLCKEDQIVVRLRMSGRTLMEIGNALGKHRERIRQVQERAYEKLYYLLWKFQNI